MLERFTFLHNCTCKYPNTSLHHVHVIFFFTFRLGNVDVVDSVSGCKYQWTMAYFGLLGNKLMHGGLRGLSQLYPASTCTIGKTTRTFLSVQLRCISLTCDLRSRGKQQCSCERNSTGHLCMERTDSVPFGSCTVLHGKRKGVCVRFGQLPYSTGASKVVSVKEGPLSHYLNNLVNRYHQYQLSLQSDDVINNAALQKELSDSAREIWPLVGKMEKFNSCCQEAEELAQLLKGNGTVRTAYIVLYLKNKTRKPHAVFTTSLDSSPNIICSTTIWAL